MFHSIAAKHVLGEASAWHRIGVEKDRVACGKLGLLAHELSVGLRCGSAFGWAIALDARMILPSTDHLWMMYSAVAEVADHPDLSSQCLSNVL